MNAYGYELGQYVILLVLKSRPVVVMDGAVKGKAHDTPEEAENKAVGKKIFKVTYWRFGCRRSWSYGPKEGLRGYCWDPVVPCGRQMLSHAPVGGACPAIGNRRERDASAFATLFLKSLNQVLDRDLWLCLLIQEAYDVAVHNGNAPQCCQVWGIARVHCRLGQEKLIGDFFAEVVVENAPEDGTDGGQSYCPVLWW